MNKIIYREQKDGLRNVISIRFGWLIGIGYWKDIYIEPFNGYAHNFLLPFMRIQWGRLKLPKEVIW